MSDQPLTSTLIGFGPYSFDKVLGTLSKRGTPIRLAGMPLQIFQHLVGRPGETVSRTELQGLLWKGAAFGDFEQGLNSAVNVVRRALNDSAHQPRYIETVPGQGYRFIAAIHSGVAAPVTRCPETALDPVPPLTDPIQAAQAPGRNRPEAPAGRNAVNAPRLRWAIAAALVLSALGAGAWWTPGSKPQALSDGSRPSVIRKANDQYELAMNFVAFQNDIPLARRTFERALELDPHFVSARLQHARTIVIEVFNGYTNDGALLYKAEEELHQAELSLPETDGLLVSTQAAVYLAQGRLDRVPLAKLEEQWRKGGNSTWLAILSMLGGQVQQAMDILRKQSDRDPMNNPSRMFLGELLRTEGDTAGAIQLLERAIQQAPGNVTAAWFLTMAYLDRGKPEQARALLEGMRQQFEKNYMWRHAWAILLAAEGKREEAMPAMDEGTLKFAQLTWAVTSTTADFYALQGDRSKAIEWLRMAIARGDERVSYFRRNQRLAMLRTDTGFRSLLRSVEARRK